MELSLNILFYFESRWKTKIISHKTESFYFHQNIWESDFIFNLDTSIQRNFFKGGFSGILSWAVSGNWLWLLFKTFTSQRYILFQKVSDQPERSSAFKNRRLGWGGGFQAPGPSPRPPGSRQALGLTPRAPLPPIRSSPPSVVGAFFWVRDGSSTSPPE